jgi:hypothetical protein
VARMRKRTAPLTLIFPVFTDLAVVDSAGCCCQLLPDTACHRDLVQQPKLAQLKIVAMIATTGSTSLPWTGF